jgi:alpha-D-ribose 1-methylphosphonate 5-triphosphate synthase subunit PhnG
MSASAEKVVGPSEFAADRAAWMGALARADAAQLAARLDDLSEAPRWTVLRAPEIGLVMVRGRAGGQGQPFNLGEMTVARAAVRLEDGAVGLGYVAGRDKAHAERAALVDAMMQSPQWRDLAQSRIVAPLVAERAQAAAETARKVAATKVEFFTMVRARTQP